MWARNWRAGRPRARAAEFPIDGRGRALPLAPAVGVGAPTTVEI